MGKYIKLIVAIGTPLLANPLDGGVIGKDNELPWYAPCDLKRFKELTTGKAVIMGRKTFLSIGMPLPNRKNIVLSRSDFKHEGVTVYGDINEALESLSDEAEIYIIGGGEIYKQAIDFCDVLEITQVVDVKVDNCDTFFPSLDKTEWRLTKQTSPEQIELAKCSHKVRFFTYVRVNKNIKNIEV